MFARAPRLLVNITSRDQARRALGLSNSGAPTLADAKKAYKKLVVELHPDRNVGLDDDVKEKKEERFKLVSAAFAYLEKEGMADASQHGGDGGGGGGGRGGSATGPNGCRWSPMPDDAHSYETRMRTKVKFAVAQVRDTGRVQHVPLMRNEHSFITVDVIAQWVDEELKAQQMHGYSVDSVHQGPFGTPCVSIRGTPKASHIPMEAQAPRYAAYTAPMRRAYSRVYDFMTEGVPG